MRASGLKSSPEALFCIPHLGWQPKNELKFLKCFLKD